LIPLTKILTYLFVVVLLGAILSPPFYWLLHGVLDHPFHRYFSRVTQVTAIILLVPMLLWLRIGSVKEFGLLPNSQRTRDVLSGFAIALIPVILLAVGYLTFDVYKFHSELLFGKLLRIAGTAVVVACMEEFIFRGVILGLAARSWGRWPAAIGTSLIFAFVHFLKPSRQPDDSVVHWGTGFMQITRITEALPTPLMLAFGVLALFVAGMILALAALRTHSLWLPIGIHAGWIFGQQGLQWVAKFRAKPAEEFLPWVGPNVVSGAVPTGLVPLGALLLTAVGIWYYLKYVSAPDRVGRP